MDFWLHILRIVTIVVVAAIVLWFLKKKNVLDPSGRPTSTPPPPRPNPAGFAAGTSAVQAEKRSPKAKVLELDVVQFAPLSDQQVTDAARGTTNLMGNLWFGRRDLIPPADDPRTNLIDRAMVTQGLVTPEQLAEIHSVGAEMDRVRPTQASIAHQAAMTGEAAVQAERAARAQLKA